MGHWRTVAALGAITLASPTWADLVITSTGSGEKANTTTYLAGKKLRIERGDAAERGITVFDGDARRVVEVNPAEKSYRVITEDQGQALHAQMQQMLAQLPPEQRARAEAALAKQRAAPSKAHDVRFEPLGSGDVVAGYRCERYRIVRGEKREEEGCFIPWSGGAATREDLAPFVELGHFMENFTAAASGGSRRASWMSEEIARAPGFPAMLERVENGKRTTVHRLVKLERKRVATDLFAIPAGYAELKSPLLEPAGARRARRGTPVP